MKPKRRWFVATFLVILLMSATSSMFTSSSLAADDPGGNNLRVVPGTWYRLETDIVTILFPAGGRKPIFIWWYTEAPDQVYVVKYQGLIEYFAFDHPMLPLRPEYYKRASQAEVDRFHEMFMTPKEQELMGMHMDMEKLIMLRQTMTRIEGGWHRPFLPFKAGVWSLSDVANITTPEGKIIGISFELKLVHLPDWMPRLKFAENNIVIKVRFYNTTVEETVQGTDIKYSVHPGEMKMDLIVNRWLWNIDSIKALITELKEHDIDLDVPTGRSRLALWVNMASINTTRTPLAMVQEDPERIEEFSTASHMEFEGAGHMSIEQNKTTWIGEEGQEKPMIVPRPWWTLWLPSKRPMIRFATKDRTLLGFFRFVSTAKTTNQENESRTVPVNAAYISAGRHLRVFLGYPYFGKGSLEHDPTIGVEVAGIETTPQYTIQTPSIGEIAPTVTGKYALPLVTVELAFVLAAALSAVAVVLYIVRWRRKPINMVGTG